MVGERLRQLALQAPGAGRLNGEDLVHGAAEHPICGDELVVDLRLAAGRIEALAWRARGCPATLAVAAALSSAWIGIAPADARERLDLRLAELGGLARHERHAAELALRALAAATAGQGR